MKTILFVSMVPGDALRAAKKLGARIVLITDKHLTWQREYIDVLLTADPYHPSDSIAAVEPHSAGGAISAVLTYDERAVPCCARVAAKIGTPSNSYETAYAARNKFEMRRRFAAHGLSVPRFQVARTEAEAQQVATDITGFPLIIKPLFGFASQGVLRVDELDGLGAAVRRVQAIIASHRYFIHDDPYGDCVLLEEYMSGPEVAVDGLLSQGKVTWIGIFDKPTPLVGPTFEETIYTTPSEQPRAIQSLIFAETQKGLEALGLRNGVLHAELRITPDGPRIIEIAARPIGGVCGRALTYCLGQDYHELVIRNALGETVTLDQGSRVPAGVMMLPSPGDGRLRAVYGLEKAQRVPGVRDVFIMAKPGDVIRSFPEQSCYLGFITATGACIADVVTSLNECHARLRFDLDQLEDVNSPT